MSEAGIVRVDNKKFELRNLELKQMVDTLAVVDAPTCLQAKTAQRDIRSEMKMRHSVLDPFVESAKRNLAEAKDELNKWIVPLTAMDEALAVKVKDFERREREAAEAEQRRINEERRIAAEAQAKKEREERERVAAEERKLREAEIEKQRKAGELKAREAQRLQKEVREAEERERERAAKDEVIAAANVQTVTVAPSIPTVAGVPSRRNYKARVIDASKVPDQYWVIDEQALGAEARKAKTVGEIIPGVLFYED